MEFKILNKTLFICDKWGNLGRRISENVIFGTFDDKTSTFLVTKQDGKVELRDLNGTVRRVISNDGFEARFHDNEIYDETLEKQPFEKDVNRNTTLLKNNRSEFNNTDPLQTAGIVGNLDRKKIGHYKMGNKKYNHLYGGQL